MKRIYTLLFVALFIIGNLFAQEKEIKNVILMIPDGTSLASISTARWYQRYNTPEKTNLNIDPYICGTVLTYSSNAPIGDSAPTTSCYMTGIPSQAGYVSTYPPVDKENDIIPLDETMSYQPLMTLMEAARIIQNKSTGLVFTCEFPHATPADCAAHSYNRSKYEWIVPQMVHNQLDVVIGGGVSLLDENLQAYLKSEDYAIYLDDLSYQNSQNNRFWALFGAMQMGYEIDRDPNLMPSLAEMTRKAIETLSKNEEGFFLMVEGSLIDWAAHSNDAAAIIHDVLSFDEACGVAFDFAQANGETVVIVVPDHGNSGLSIGKKGSPSYTKLTKDQLFDPVSKMKVSIDGLLKHIQKAKTYELKNIVFELTGITLSDEEFQELADCRDYDMSIITPEESMYGTETNKMVSEIINKRSCFGFTTDGHTGEEVFLAVLDPRENRLMGHKSNLELHTYLYETLGLEESLLDLTHTYFAKHQEVFQDYTYSIKMEEDIPVLTVKNKKNRLEIRPNTNIVKQNGKDVKLESVIVYVDRNETFYLQQSLKQLM